VTKEVVIVNDRDLTVDEFCAKHNMCRSMYYKLRKAGNGPDEIRVNTMTRITPEADRRWVVRHTRGAK